MSNAFKMPVKWTNWRIQDETTRAETYETEELDRRFRFS